MIVFYGTDPYDTIDDEDIYVGYRRRCLIELKKVQDPDDDIPDDIKWKLFLARQVALAKFKEIHG